MQRKTSFPLAFHSLIRNFARCNSKKECHEKISLGRHTDDAHADGLGHSCQARTMDEADTGQRQYGKRPAHG